MLLDDRSYVPTLAVRPSEMNGLELLPGAAKDRMMPCFLLAPWMASNSLENTIKRIERAFPNRNYFLDIDQDYRASNTQNMAQQEFEELKNSDHAHINWINFVKKSEKIIPCLQTRGLREPQIRDQIEGFQNLGRAYCTRILKDYSSDNLVNIVGALSSTGAADFTIILEGGWVNDSLSLAAWFGGIITESLNEINATIPIVVSCTSMPQTFTSFNGDLPYSVTFANRELVDQVAKNTNRQRIYYGDWGSTRPRQESGMSSRPLPRVDYPTDKSWLIARNKEAGWTFRNAALAIIRSPDWNGQLGIWGEEMIFNTTINESLGIDTSQKNVASRVNIHLYRQSFFGQPNPVPAALDEDWQD